MPVLLTFDIGKANTRERDQIQNFFEKFGWENVGGSAYRYPDFGTKNQPVEDWFNHIVPALMLFRSFLISSNVPLKYCTIDAQASAGYNSVTDYGNPPAKSTDQILFVQKQSVWRP